MDQRDSPSPSHDNCVVRVSFIFVGSLTKSSTPYANTLIAVVISFTKLSLLVSKCTPVIKKQNNYLDYTTCFLFFINITLFFFYNLKIYGDIIFTINMSILHCFQYRTKVSTLKAMITLTLVICRVI